MPGPQGRVERSAWVDLKLGATLLMLFPLAVGVLPLRAPAAHADDALELVDAEVDHRVEFLVTKYGMAMDEAQHQMFLADKWELPLQEIGTLYRQSWAGAWLDHEAPGHINVNVTDASTREALEGDGLEELSVRIVPFSSAELAAAKADLLAELRTEFADLDYQLASDIRTNGLALTYNSQGLTDTEVSDIEARAADSPVSVTINADESYRMPELIACNRIACDPPMRAGITLQAEQGEICTTGFNFESDSNILYFVSTAGHCTDDWSHVHTHNSQPIGQNILGCFCWAFDIMLVVIDNPGYWRPKNVVYRNPNFRAVNVLHKISNPSAALEGLVICGSGRASGEVCGELTDYDITSAVGVENSGRFDEPMCYMDSGSPVYNDHTTFVNAYGIASSVDQPCVSGGTYFTWTATFEDAFDVHVKLTPYF